jgi:hypothetical protein
VRRGFAPVVREVLSRWWGPEPIGAAMARVQAFYRGQQLGPGNGYPHFGMKGDASTTWLGWTASPQHFRGAAQMGSIPGESAPVNPLTALPSDIVPPALPAWLEQYETLQGMAGG